MLPLLLYPILRLLPLIIILQPRRNRANLYPLQIRLEIDIE